MEPHDLPTFGSLPPIGQFVAAVLIIAGSAIVAVKGWLKGKPESSAASEEDVTEALKHLRWIARHAERQADAAEEANRLTERHLAALERLAVKARSPPKARASTK